MSVKVFAHRPSSPCNPLRENYSSCYPGHHEDLYLGNQAKLTMDCRDRCLSTKEKAEHLAMANYIGQQLGNYRLTRLLGQGGFAEVYLGEHVRLGMKAAVKILHTHLAEEEVRAFQQEARIIADLKHPLIIRILDFDVEQGTPFLVLDYAPHGSLRQKHPRGSRLPLSLVVTYVTQVASALQYAHDHKLIHRDIKPENMLLGDRGEVLLSDFGIATIAHSTSSMSTQASMGTLAYMAPEQIQGKPRSASDQYALGIVVYQWLSGTMPFRGSSTEILAQHLAVMPPALRTYAPDLPLEIEQAVMRALAKDPKERFDTVQDFADTLQQALQEEGEALKSSQHTIQPGNSKSPEQAVLVLTPTQPAASAPLPQTSQRPYPPAARSSLPPIWPSVKEEALISRPSTPQRYRFGPIGGTLLIISIVILLGSIFLLSRGADSGSMQTLSTPTPTTSPSGSLDAPFHLSATNRSVQPVHVWLSHWSAYSDQRFPEVMVDDLQITSDHMVLHLSTKGGNTAASLSIPDSIACAYPCNGSPPSHPPDQSSSLDRVLFSAIPHVGEKWRVNIALSLGYKSNSPNTFLYYIVFQF